MTSYPQVLRDRGELCEAANISDLEFQVLANAGVLPAAAGIYNGAPLWLEDAVETIQALIPNARRVLHPPSKPQLHIVHNDPAPAPIPDPPAARATMTVDQVCTRLSTSPATLKKRRDLGLAPEFKLDGRNVLYFADAVDAIYAEHGKLPRHYSPDGLAAMKANAEKARAKSGGRPKKYVPMAGEPALPLVEQKPIAEPGRKQVFCESLLSTDEAADHLGIAPIMMHILRHAGIGPAVAESKAPYGYRMRDLNLYIQQHGLERGQISRADKNHLDERVRVPEATRITGLTQKALEHHRAKGTGPDWERQGIFSVYKRGDLYAYNVGRELLAEAAWQQQHARANGRAAAMH